MAETDLARVEAAAAQFKSDYEAVKAEVAKAVVGHDDVVEGVLTCLFIGGHALLEGVPGLGKTLLIRSLSDALRLSFSRIQFTPDLMPADVTGTTVVVETEQGREFRFQRGPIFAQIVLADEINRATPKTQAALLEAMQEKQVTVGGETYTLDKPFFVMATQNPIEQEGTYPLPEAQLDRFLYKLTVGYSDRTQLSEIITRTTTGYEPNIQSVLSAEQILAHQGLVRSVIAAPHVQDYAVRCVLSTHPEGEFATPLVNKFVRVGASPRAAQALILAGKVRALVDGRANVSMDDIRAAMPPALRHRLLLNFEGEAEGMTTDQIVENIAETLPREAAMV
jgi:MoxR-like ATPase